MQAASTTISDIKVNLKKLRYLFYNFTIFEMSSSKDIYMSDDDDESDASVCSKLLFSLYSLFSLNTCMIHMPQYPPYHI